MSRVVYLHIGAPKTGTTYLQDRLDRNAARLKGHNVHLPPGPLGLRPSHAHFKAALDLMGMDWGGPPGHADGHWDALMRRVRRLDGTVVISHEILAGASVEQVRRAHRDLADGELHVIYSARDLARQIPAAWQEGVKQGRRWTFQKFLRQVRERPEAPFWRAQDLPAVLGRWGAGSPVERLHLITVPPPGAPRDLLWQRFCGVVGIDPVWAPEDSDRENPSMGIAETALVRQLNRRLRSSGIDSEVRRALVKEMLAQRHLAGGGDRNRATLPPQAYPWARAVADRWVGWVQHSGIHVVGDLAELYPAEPREGGSWTNPDRPEAKGLVEAALTALTAMTQEAARRSPAEQQLSRRVGRAARRITGR